MTQKCCIYWGDLQRKKRAIINVVPNFTNKLYKHQMQFDIIVPLHEFGTKYDNQFGAEVEFHFCLFVQKSMKYKQTIKSSKNIYLYIFFLSVTSLLTFNHLTIASIVCDTDLPSMLLKDIY